jgi:hypothetical protein
MSTGVTTYSKLFRRGRATAAIAAGMAGSTLSTGALGRGL